LHHSPAAVRAAPAASPDAVRGERRGDVARPEARIARAPRAIRHFASPGRPADGGPGRSEPAGRTVHDIVHEITRVRAGCHPDPRPGRGVKRCP